MNDARPPAPVRPDAVPPGSRLENLALFLRLLSDLLTNLGHMVVFLLTKRRRREAFRQLLEASALEESPK